jgi:ATP/ADP translocase
VDNVTKAALFAVFVGVFISFFGLFIAVWFVNRNGGKPNYLLRVARKYSVSPLFGQSRLTLLRALQKPPI